VRGRLVRRSELLPGDDEAMYSLFTRHFDGVPRQQFQADLDQKNWVILLHADSDGALQGFTTLHFYDVLYKGAALSIVYSGDTIVDPAAWGRSAFSEIWIGSVNYLRREHGAGPLYWFLLVSGYRTYRFLPLYWRNFHPRYDAPTPPETRHLIDFLARERFGPLYHPEQAVVRFPSPQVLRPELRGIPPRRLGDPHIAFFASRNPGHLQGDELVCLTELSRDNLTPAGMRVWNSGEHALARGRLAP